LNVVSRGEADGPSVLDVGNEDGRAHYFQTWRKGRERDVSIRNRWDEKGNHQKSSSRRDTRKTTDLGWGVGGNPASTQLDWDKKSKG